MSEEKEKEKEEKPFPPQRGRLILEGRKAIPVWLRAFDLNKEIETVQKLLEAKPERKRAVVPIVAEYTIDERLKCIFVIQVQVDTLGIMDGVGILYWTSPEYEKETREMRDEHANEMLQKLHTARHFDEVIEVEEKREE